MVDGQGAGAAEPAMHEAALSTDESPLEEGHPITLAIAGIIYAHLDCQASEARLFDTPSWVRKCAHAHHYTQRFRPAELDARGLPSPQRVAAEVYAVSVGTVTCGIVQVLAVGLLDRMLCCGSQIIDVLDVGFVASPGARINGQNWAIIWLFCVHFAAKIYYDVRPRALATPHSTERIKPRKECLPPELPPH